jgi:hypothetical protein
MYMYLIPHVLPRPEGQTEGEQGVSRGGLTRNNTNANVAKFRLRSSNIYVLRSPFKCIDQVSGLKKVVSDCGPIFDPLISLIEIKPIDIIISGDRISCAHAQMRHV